MKLQIKLFLLNCLVAYIIFKIAVSFSDTFTSGWFAGMIYGVLMLSVAANVKKN